ncbi:response regulator transcription factor [Enteroscipio rubneri]|nr:LuxR C-terminal-related transcriptional regulator [Enteroscipio rubneri]
MPNDQVRTLFNAPNERRSVVAGIVQSGAGRGRIALTMACYTVWMVACCSGPAVAVQQEPGLGAEGAGLPAWMGPLAVMAVASLIIALWFKRTRKVPEGASWLMALASVMTLGSALHLVWALDRSLPLGADMALYVAMSVLVGIGAALFRVEIDRVFGWIGTQQTLYQGMIGTAVAIAVFVFCSSAGDSGQAPVALYGLALALPFASQALLRHVVRGFPRSRYFAHGKDVPLPFPATFVATSGVQGVAAGMLYMGLFLYGGGIVFGSVEILAGQLAAATLLLATLVFLRMDFNRLIYKVAFPFAAAGFVLLAAAPAFQTIGVMVLMAGFCYLDLVLWSLGACLMKNMGLPATWIASCPGAALFFGVVAGGLLAALLLDGRVLGQALVLGSFVACFLLAAALFLSSGSNLKYGWGTVQPGEGGPEMGELAGVARFSAIEHGLTQRESEVMVLLVRGKARRAICEELMVSPDTVKTHVRAVYRKFDVHSQQELIDYVVRERESLAPDDSERLLGT